MLNNVAENSPRFIFALIGGLWENLNNCFVKVKELIWQNDNLNKYSKWFSYRPKTDFQNYIPFGAFPDWIRHYFRSFFTSFHDIFIICFKITLDKFLFMVTAECYADYFHWHFYSLNIWKILSFTNCQILWWKSKFLHIRDQPKKKMTW